jgi:hypothetical protein
MSIVYIAIVRDFCKILCEYAEYNGNFQQISLNILKENKNSDLNELVVKFENSNFFLLKFERVTIITLVDGEVKSHEILYLMTNLKNKLLKKYQEDFLFTCPAYSLKDFIPIIKTQILFYKSNSIKRKSKLGI